MTALIIGIILVVGGVAFAAAPFLKRDAAEHDGALADTIPADAVPVVEADAVPSPSEEVTPLPARPGDAPADLEAMAERLVRDERRRVASCATCGPRPEPGARFCSHCGRPLGGCPSCGREPRIAGARFCDHCGTALASP